MIEVHQTGYVFAHLIPNSGVFLFDAPNFKGPVTTSHVRNPLHNLDGSGLIIYQLSCNKNRDIEEEELRALELSYSWYTRTVIDYDHGVHTLITSRGRSAMNGTNYSVKGLHDDPRTPPPSSFSSLFNWLQVINGLVFITINGWKPC